jgi:hypothetical protein
VIGLLGPRLGAQLFETIDNELNVASVELSQLIEMPGNEG